MKLHEVIEAHGPIVAAASEVDLLIAYDAEEHAFTVVEGDQAGNYTAGDAYDAESKRDDLDAIEEEAGELLDEILEGADDTE